MKMLRNAIQHHNLLSTSAAITLATVSAAAFWFVSSPRVSGADCTLCHKRTLTITVVCGSDDYRRHIDHGDTIGACSITPTGNQ
jgi:hypothetical protein